MDDTFLGPSACETQLSFETFLRVAAGWCCLSQQQIRDAEILLQVLACYSPVLHIIALPCFLSKAKLGICPC